MTIKRILAIFLILCLFFTTACENRHVESQEPPESSGLSYEFSSESLQVEVPLEEEMLIDGKILQVQVGLCIYEIPEEIGKHKAQRFVEKQELLWDYLEAKGLQAPRNLTLRLLQKQGNWYNEEENAAYVCLRSIGSWEQVLPTLQAVMGTFANYGYLYALSNYIARDLDWQQDILSGSPAQEVEEELWNLVYPCFVEDYAASEEIFWAKYQSLRFLGQMEDPFAGEKAYLEKIQTENPKFSPTHVRFSYYGPGCPLRILSKYLDVFRDSSFTASREVEQGFMEKDYIARVSGLVQTFQDLDEEIAALRKKFDVRDSGTVPVRLTEEIDSEYVAEGFECLGLFMNEGRDPQIYAVTISSLTHEYVHYISYCKNYTPDFEPWHTEVLAYYYTLDWNYTYQLNVMKSLYPGELAYVGRLIGEPYDEPADEIKYERCAWRGSEKEEYLYGLEESNQLCAAFGEYFVRTYGEKVFIEAMLNPLYAFQRTGKYLEEIVEDWYLDMEDPEKDREVVWNH